MIEFYKILKRPREERLALNNATKAQQIPGENTNVLYGLFGMIDASGYFPPLVFLNTFLMAGSDPCDQDGRMDQWRPFSLNETEYAEVKAGSIASRPGTLESALNCTCWEDWVQTILA